MIRFGLLSSGSSGNALLVASDSTKILIDSGLSFKQLGLRAKEMRERLDFGFADPGETEFLLAVIARETVRDIVLPAYYEPRSPRRTTALELVVATDPEFAPAHGELAKKKRAKKTKATAPKLKAV